MPYIALMRAETTIEGVMRVYLEQTATFGTSPAFYFDVAAFLFSIREPKDAFMVLTSVLELPVASGC